VAYVYARAIAFKSTIILSTFRATRIVPFAPTEVIKRLRIIKEKIPILPSSSHSSSNFLPTTPYNTRQVQRQTKALRELANAHGTTMSPMLNQLAKGAEIAIHGMALLSKENEELRLMNSKVRQKRTAQRRSLAFQGALTIQEGQQRFQEQEIGEQIRQEHEAHMIQARQEQQQQAKEAKEARQARARQERQARQARQVQQKQAKEARQARARQERQDAQVERRAPKCSKCGSLAHNARICQAW
jgi:hypothetical protein